MKKFTEWVSKTYGDISEFGSQNDLGMITNEDESLVLNQLEQLADRVVGVLNNINETKRQEFVEKLISNIREKL